MHAECMLGNATCLMSCMVQLESKIEAAMYVSSCCDIPLVMEAVDDCNRKYFKQCVWVHGQQSLSATHAQSLQLTMAVVHE